MKSAVLNQASTFNMLQTLKTQLISFIEEFQGVYLNSPEGSSPHN